MELLLIRHARPFHITDLAGADPDLTPEGEGQAALLAEALASGRYGRVTRLISSPMRRAAQTAGFAADALSLDVMVDDRLAELDRGWTSYGVDFDDYVDRRALWADMNAGRVGANSFDIGLFRARVLDGIAGAIERALGEVTAVVCHGGVINVCVADTIGASQTFFTEPFYTSVTRLHVDARGYREVLSLNEIDHLRTGTSGAGVRSAGVGTLPRRG